MHVPMAEIGKTGAAQAVPKRAASKASLTRLTLIEAGMAVDVCSGRWLVQARVVKD
jgi:hypothetical protein